jgi:hypothetical protein
MTVESRQFSTEFRAISFDLAQASDLGIVNVSFPDPITTRFTIGNFGVLPARNVAIRIKEDHFPSFKAMNFYRYDPLTEMDRFREDQTGKYDRASLTKQESAETLSGIGPNLRFVGHLRHNDNWVAENRFPFPNAPPRERSIICFIVNIDWDDALKHRKTSACYMLANGKRLECQQFVMGLPERSPEKQQAN